MTSNNESLCLQLWSCWRLPSRRPVTLTKSSLAWTWPPQSSSAMESTTWTSSPPMTPLDTFLVKSWVTSTAALSRTTLVRLTRAAAMTTEWLQNIQWCSVRILNVDKMCLAKTFEKLQWIWTTKPMLHWCVKLILRFDFDLWSSNVFHRPRKHNEFCSYTLLWVCGLAECLWKGIYWSLKAFKFQTRLPSMKLKFLFEHLDQKYSKCLLGLVHLSSWGSEISLLSSGSGQAAFLFIAGKML